MYLASVLHEEPTHLFFPLNLFHILRIVQHIVYSGEIEKDPPCRSHLKQKHELFYGAQRCRFKQQSFDALSQR